MKTTSLRLSLLILIPVFFTGCVMRPTNRPAQPLSKLYQTKAMDYENKGELQMALLFWRIAAVQKPGDKEISDKIAALKTCIRNKADEHFTKGTTLYSHKSLEAARKEFLIAIRLNPNHKEALFYLKKKLAYTHYTTYKVENGDTYNKISRKIYKNPGRGFIIATFNDCNPQKQPVPGEIIKIPILDKKFTKPIIDLEKELMKARESLHLKNYDEAAHVIEEILEYFPESEAATNLKNEIYFHQGIHCKEEKDYVQSLTILQKVNPEYKDIESIISEVKKLARAQADMHYKNGLTHFVNDRLIEAIEEWEKILDLYPNDEKALQSITRTRNLLKKLESIK
ncbi:MAG: tetratricopeptide repeat protein [bacterium]